ncbi:MAG: hypothetical protein ACYTEL_01305 [Planctomycetota bacterium]|jgi:hypothetical protein
MRRFRIAVLFFAVLAPLSAGQEPGREVTSRQADKKRPNALELLDKYAETQGKLRSFIAKGGALHKGFSSGMLAGKPWRGRYFVDYEARCDGRRASFRSYIWGRVNSHPQGYYPEDKPAYQSALWDGETHFQYDKVGSALGSFDVHEDSGDGTRRAEITLVDNYPGKMLMGYFYPEKIRIDLRLRKADAMSVREKMEDVGGSACYVIEARIKKGEYKLWIDPQHGYNIAKVEIERSEGDAIVERFSFSLTNVPFKEVQNVWLPVKGHAESRHEYRNGHYCTSSYEFEIKEIVLNPDHDALSSFVPDDIKDGAEARILFGRITLGADGPRHVWSRNPKFVVDEQFREVKYDPNTMRIRVVRALPKLKQFDLDLGADWATEEMVLVCFWEMGQPDSEQLVAALKERQESLAEKGVAVILVEACAATRARLKSWASRNEIAFPVGSFSERRLEELRKGWNIENLPRLVLTDRKHVITAEGFGLAELDEKIKEVADASD